MSLVRLSILILDSLKYLVYCLFGTEVSAVEILMMLETTLHSQRACQVTECGHVGESSSL